MKLNTYVQQSSNLFAYNRLLQFLVMVLAACLGVTRLCDALGWSRFLFLKKKMYSPLALSVEPAAPLTFPS